MWSLGATLYAAVEGRSPYARETAMSTLMALATEEPDPPAKAGMLAPVLLGLLRHDPATRLTASEVERRLRMVVAAAPGGGGVPSPRRARAAASTASPVAVRTLPVQRVSPDPVSPAQPSPQPPPRRPVRPRAMLIGIGLAGAVLVAAGGYILHRTDVPVARPAPTASLVPSATGSAVTAAGFSPASCSGPAPATAVRLPQPGAATGVNGWSLTPGWSYFDDGTGFHMPVPDGWTYTRAGSMYCFRDPEGYRVLSLDTARNPAGDPVVACRDEAARLVAAGALPGYAQIAIEKRPLLNRAADWEYRYRDPSGVLLHVQTRWFASNRHGYALSWATREIDWSADLGKINMVLSTFYTDKVS
jgi:hypothetical protein